MKRIFRLMLLAAAFAVLFSGCGKKIQPLDTSSMPAAVTFEAEGLRCSTDESRLPEFSFVYEYGNDKESRVWLWDEKGMNGAALVGLDYSEDAEKPVPGEMIYTFGDIENSEGILLYIQLSEDAAPIGFSYSSGDESLVYVISAGESGTAPVLTQLQ